MYAVLFVFVGEQVQFLHHLDATSVKLDHEKPKDRGEIPIEPNWPRVLKINPPKQKGHLGSRFETLWNHHLQLQLPNAKNPWRLTAGTCWNIVMEVWFRSFSSLFMGDL